MTISWGGLDLKYDTVKNTDEPDPLALYFPDLVYLQNPDKCIRAANELILMIKDYFEHTLPPLHQHALYMMLLEAQELYNDMQKDKNQQTDQTSSFSSAIEDEIDDDKEFSLDDENLDDPDFYLEFCFDDIDFMSVADFFHMYKNNYEYYLGMGMDLDQYIDLMPNDIREEYECIKREKSAMT